MPPLYINPAITGPTGATGVMPTSVTGATGATGLRPSGVTGSTGATGPTGVSPTGPTGVMQTGATGAAVPDVKSTLKDQILYLDNALNVSGSTAFTISQGTMTTNISSLLVSNASKFGGNIDISLNTISNIGGANSDFISFRGAPPVYENFIYGKRLYYKIFTNATFTTSLTNVESEIFMVGGGGAGGTYFTSGGGGAGGLQTNWGNINSALRTPGFATAFDSQRINASTTITKDTTYTVVIGAGGLMIQNAAGDGGDGSNTTFTVGTTTIVTAQGGGGGGLNTTTPARGGGCGGGDGHNTGNAGGSSGGTGSQGGGGAMGDSTSANGGSEINHIAGGGGGGLGGVGIRAPITKSVNGKSPGGQGGPGILYANQYYGGGGAGGGDAVGLGGIGGGGNGGAILNAQQQVTDIAKAGAPGTGGGGGGLGQYGNIAGTATGDGGTGVFIISFAINNLSKDIQFVGTSNAIQTFPSSVNITANSNVFVRANILPGSNNLYNLGSRYQRWKNIYTSNPTIAQSTLYFDYGSNDDYTLFSANGQVVSAIKESSYISSLPGVSVNSNFLFAGGDDVTNPLRWSAEGTVWSNVPYSILVNPVHDVAYDGRAVWVLAGKLSNASSGAFASGDSIRWNDIPTLGNAYHTPGPTNAVCYCGRDGRWYAVGVDVCGANTILRSARQDEQKWSNAVGSNSAFFWSGVGRSVAWDGNATVVACGDSTDSNSAILWTNVASNGTVWYDATYVDLSTRVNVSGQCVAYDGVRWVCAGGEAGILTSVNGKAWANVFNASGFAAQCAEWNGQTWLVGGVNTSASGGPGLYYTTDQVASSWASVSESVGWNVRSVAWNGTVWVAANFNTMLKSQSVTGPWLSTVGSNLFSGNVNNIANTVLLPNAPVNKGQAMLTGAGAPNLQLGNVGDLYTDTTNRYIYGPKTEIMAVGGSTTLSWGAPTIPIAQPQTFYGVGVPETNPTGSKPGDFYIDTATGVRYAIY